MNVSLNASGNRIRLAGWLGCLVWTDLPGLHLLSGIGNSLCLAAPCVRVGKLGNEDIVRESLWRERYCRKWKG